MLLVTVCDTQLFLCNNSLSSISESKKMYFLAPESSFFLTHFILFFCFVYQHDRSKCIFFKPAYNLLWQNCIVFKIHYVRTDLLRDFQILILWLNFSHFIVKLTFKKKYWFIYYTQELFKEYAIGKWQISNLQLQ